MHEALLIQVGFFFPLEGGAGCGSLGNQYPALGNMGIV